MRILIACLLLLPFSVFAGSVGTTKTFASGDTLTATDLNGNVSALTAAIDDNDSRVTINESAIAAIKPAVGLFANGQLIAYLGYDQDNFISTNGYIFGIDGDGNGTIMPIFSILGGTIFVSSNCGGQGYTINPHLLITGISLTNGFVFKQNFTGNIVQVPDNAQILATLNYNSYLSGAGCVVSSGTANSVYPVQANDPMVTGVQNSYTPPFHIGFQ